MLQKPAYQERYLQSIMMEQVQCQAEGVDKDTVMDRIRAQTLTLLNMVSRLGEMSRWHATIERARQNYEKDLTGINMSNILKRASVSV